MKLSEFVTLVKSTVNDPLLDSGCPLCFHTGEVSNTHKCDWKSFYHVFKDNPEYLIANMEYTKLINSPPTLPEEVK